MSTRIVVLGFYDRSNLGDDAYIVAFTKLFPDANIIFFSMDDVTEVPADTDIVICGGGDIINDYFMCKAQQILKDFKGLVYAVSIGIPYLTGAKYLHMFDHVFARSIVDYETAVKEVGSRNVSRIDDATFVLSSSYNSDFMPPTSTLRVGIALAQPVFYNNLMRQYMIESIGKALIEFYKTQNSSVEYHILAFNHNTNNPQECDYLVNQSLYQYLQKSSIPSLLQHDIKDVGMIDYININIDLMLCMRYHSVVFSYLAKTRFLALYSTPKVNNFLQTYFPDSMNDHYALELNSSFKPFEIDERVLINKLTAALHRPVSLPPVIDVPLITSIVTGRKTQDILITTEVKLLDDVLSTCKRAIIKYLHIDADVYDQILKVKGPFTQYLGTKSALSFARFVCYLISNQTGHPCIWGFAENLKQQDFCLFDTIKFIWERCVDIAVDAKKVEHYYPKPPTLRRRAIVNMDFIFQSDFSSYHRSGWAYVVGGLMNLDAPRLARRVEGNILIDTYVDRSFHWGRDILESLNVIPYTQPWIGFIHHTFDTSHSDYNCNTLFMVPQFLESLKVCKGLISLTPTHGAQLRSALESVGFSHVKVHVIYHPMEFVNNMFTMEKFLSNPDKKIIQIGAWMRNPYAIYQLNIDVNPTKNNLPFTKVALKGRDMEQYFAPPRFLEVMRDALLTTEWYAFEPLKPNVVPLTHYCCRPGVTETNKFCQGVYTMLESQTKSVMVMDKVSNTDYDDLLSKNIVFLNLIDCSAVNTVIECIVRNTVLIVNRHSALEEMLGVNYPGFYDNIAAASQMCKDVHVINVIYNYLLRMNKERYTLAYFLDRFQDVIEKDECIVPPPIESLYSFRTVLRNKYQRCMSLLPNIFSS